MKKSELLDGLNDQLNREVTTFLRYMLQAASIPGAEDEGLIALKMKMEEQAADEDEHGQEMRRLLGEE